MDIINQLLNKIHLRTRMTRMGVDGLRWVTGCSWLLGSEGMVAGVTSGCPARAWAGTGCRRGRGCWRRAGWRTRPAAPRGLTATPPGPPPSSSWTAACWSPQPANNHHQTTIIKYIKFGFIPLSSTDCCTRRIFSYWGYKEHVDTKLKFWWDDLITILLGQWH